VSADIRLLSQGKPGCSLPLKLIILSLKYKFNKGPFSGELIFAKTNFEICFYSEMFL
jgi:hypothetical protein